MVEVTISFSLWHHLEIILFVWMSSSPIYLYRCMQHQPLQTFAVQLGLPWTFLGQTQQIGFAPLKDLVPMPLF